MKRYHRLYSCLAVFAITAIMSSTTVFASSHSTGKSDTTKSKMNSNTMMVNIEAVTMHGGYSILGSNLIGMEIENSQGENLGEVKDIVLDSKGKVRYVAVSYGGFMGMGDKMYAVPMEAFSLKREKGMFYDDALLILNVTEDQLKNEKGFDNENWPNLDDETYRIDLDKRYNVQRPHMNK